MSIFTKNAALSNLWKLHKEQLCRDEALDASCIEAALEAGTMVLLANPEHKRVKPVLVGQPCRVKVNANIGTSPLSNCVTTECKKATVAENAGADTIMDLSIAGDLMAIRTAFLENCPLPLGTVPLYAVAQKFLDNDQTIAAMKPDDIFHEIALQAAQGVDFMTIHCGLTRRGAGFATEDGGRVMGIVSRGGALLTRWMREHNKENPLFTDFDRLIELALKYNITFSLGDGLRPGAGADAGDAAQWDEVIELGRLAKYAHERGVQCMIEGPGHVPLQEVEAQITSIKKLTQGAPLYVLGPLTIDSAAGYDHIAGAIGAALAVRAGVDFLCYLTPAEHLALPSVADVHVGVMASRVAAQAGEVALGRPQALARELGMNTARAQLDWEGMAKYALDPCVLHERRKEHAHEDVCAMCGKFCAVKMLKPNA